MKHKHAALIAEWIKDTSRVVECTGVGGEVWVKVDGNPLWSERNEYRFAPVKPVVTSSLTDAELYVIWKMPRNTFDASRRAIANAAAQAQDALTRKAVIAEIMALPAVTGLSDDDLWDIDTNAYQANVPNGHNQRSAIANAAIKHFLASLPWLLKVS